MANIFKQEVSLIDCEIYYFSRDEETKISFFSVWVKDGLVVKGPLGRLGITKAMEAGELVEMMREQGYRLDIL